MVAFAREGQGCGAADSGESPGNQDNGHLILRRVHALVAGCGGYLAVFFAHSLAIGRIISMIVDGMPGHMPCLNISPWSLSWVRGGCSCSRASGT